MFCLQCPVVDIYGNHRFIDIALISGRQHQAAAGDHVREKCRMIR